MILFPQQILSLMTHSTAPVTPLSTELLQWLGGLALALTTPLLLSYPNTAAGVASRYTTYWTLGAGEAFLIALMGYQGLSGTSAFTARAMVASSGVLGATLAWRLYALILKPEIVGQVVDEKKRA